MPIAIDPKAISDYILEREYARDKDGKRTVPMEGATVFHIHPLKSDEDEIVARAMKDNDAAFLNSGLRSGLAGWSTFKDAKGVDVPFEVDVSGKPTVATLSRLSRSDRAEIAVAIMQLGTSKPTSAELER